MANKSAARPLAAPLSAEGLYGRWAPVYDLIFDLPFHPGRAAAARAAAEAAGASGEVLVVGVGTGLELGLLPKTLRVTGIDLSTRMLDIARDRVARKGLRQVKALQVMDAAALEFPAARFDVALAPYVMSVVPSPARALDEMWRVVKPGGEIVIVNHFSSERGLRARIEQAMEQSASWLGWHPVFPYAAISEWLAGRKKAQVIEKRQVAPFRMFTLLRVKKTA
ncbi:MAG TPA: class I SAM-dependent methyltransferase [Roseiarcus sp.]|nr:class I SAM-dependent methyltransferase [Roseiarcus sp.]